MATREENLKKINDELEKLDDEELEKVAGGNWWTKIRSDINLNTADDKNPASNQPGVKAAVNWL